MIYSSLRVLTLAGLVGLAGCVTDPETGRALMPSDPGAFRLEPLTVSHLRAPQLVTVANGYSAKVIVPTMSKFVDADLRTVSETAVVMLSRALQDRGIGIAQEAPKKVTLRVSQLKMAGAPMVSAVILLEAEYGVDGRTAVPMQNTGFSAQRAVDGAILFALIKLVADEGFSAYLNN